MVDMIQTSWGSDSRLDGPLARWSSFQRELRDSDRVGLVYHGDMDGVIGAAYARRAILSGCAATLEPLWIRTDEYDFGSLRTWLAAGHFAKCVVADMSVASHRPTMQAMVDSVRDRVFIYDHHLLPIPPPASEKIVLANPTPAPLEPGEAPVPTFAFALRLAAAHGLAFPKWLLLMAVFSEGVDSFAPDETAALLQEVFALSSIQDLRKAYRQSPLPRVLGYVRADFSTEPKRFLTLDALDAVCRGEVATFEEFSARLSKDLAPVASAIGRSISDTVDQWKDRIAKDKMKAVVVIPVETAEVAGPVASILRGAFPDKVIVTRTSGRPNVTFELRARNDSPLNLPSVLSIVASRVEAVNFGGHSAAAGALVEAANADSFAKELERELTAEVEKRESQIR